MNKHTRNKKILKLYTTTGLTFRQIGDRFNLSHERARQIVLKLDPTLYKDHRKVRKGTMPVEHTCPTCGVSFMAPDYKSKIKKYCSRTCIRRPDARKNIYPEWVGNRSVSYGSQHQFTPEQWKELMALRTRSYYQRHPKEWCKRQRQWYKDNKDRYKLYLKRCRERKLYGKAITPLPNPKNIPAVKP